ncbi:lebercilin [Stigmatopora argus]
MESKFEASEDDWDDSRSRRSYGSSRRSRASAAGNKHKRYKNIRNGVKDEKVPAKSERYTTEPDQASDGDGKAACYSDDYESEGSLSPYNRERTLSPPPAIRTNFISTSSPYNTAMEKRVRARPPRPLRSRVSRSHSKESLPVKKVDPLTRQMLSGRMLKITEMQNVHAEQKQRIADLEKENRILKRLLTRQEKALQSYTDAESKISQMLSCHANETHALRERLRRTRERERAAERRLKEKEDQLLRSHATLGRMKKLVEQRELGAREDLSSKLDQERGRTYQAELKIKELEKNMELNQHSHQRQLAAEKKKMLSAQEEIRTLQKELEQLTLKLREKERELETMNIYAHRMGKISPRKVTDADAKSPKPCGRAHNKAVQTEERDSSPEFPSPPPPPASLEDRGPAPDGYLSLKADVGESQPKPDEERPEKASKGLKFAEETKETADTGRQSKDSEKRKWNHISTDWEKEATGGDFVSFLSHSLKSARKDAERRRTNPDGGDAGESRRRKDQLLAKMREIDLQNEGPVFVNSPASSGETPSRRWSLRSLRSDDEPPFGSYAPAFGSPGRKAAGGEDGSHALKAIGVFSLKTAAVSEDKSKKSALMQQLFGSLAAANSSEARKTDLLERAASGDVSARGGSLASGRLGFSAPPSRHVVESRPAIRAVASFDEDIEELTL